jgi:hypothetical protein
LEHRAAHFYDGSCPFYPILAITVQWLAGHAIDFGGQEVIAASPLQARIFFLIWLGSSLIFVLFMAASKSLWGVWLILASGILILGSIYADGFAVPKKVAVASSVVGVGAGIFAFVFADAGAVAVASVFAVIEKRSRHPLVW